MAGSSRKIMPMSDPTRARIGLVSKLCLSGAVVGILAVLWITLARPVWHHLQVHRHLNAVAANMAGQRWSVAAEHLVEAHRLAPHDADMLLMMVDFLHATTDDPHLLVQTLDDLRDAGRSRPDHALMRVKALLDDGRPTEARAALNALSPPERESADGWTIESRLCHEEGDAAAARHAALEALSKRKDDADAQLQLAIVESWNTPFEVQDAARRRLWQIAAGKDAAAHAAIEHLAADPVITGNEAEQLLRFAETHPMPKHGTRLSALSAVMKKKPEERKGLLAAEVDRYRGAEPSVLRQVVLWLASESEHGHVLDLLPARLARSTRELFPCYVISLAQVGRWKELREELQAPSVPADRELVNMWLAWAEGFLHPEGTRTRQQLESAITGAKKARHVEALRSAAQVAGIHDLNDLELDARLARASMLPREESILLAEALPLARRLNDTRQLLAISHRLAQLRPASEGFELQAKYYALLMGEALEKQPLAPAKADAAHVLVAALAAYRLNDEKRLAELLNPAPDATAMQPGMRAVMAGLLARIGESARAFQLAEKIQLGSLLPEEKRFWELAR